MSSFLFKVVEDELGRIGLLGIGYLLSVIPLYWSMVHTEIADMKDLTLICPTRVHG